MPGAGLRLLSPAFFTVRKPRARIARGQVSEFLEKMQKPGYEKKEILSIITEVTKR